MYLPPSYHRAVRSFRLGHEGEGSASFFEFTDYLHHNLPKVTDPQALAEVNLLVGQLLAAQERGDYLFLADLLEFELPNTRLAQLFPIQSVELIPSLPSPQPLGTAISFTARVNGGDAPEEWDYFYMVDPPDEFDWHKYLYRDRYGPVQEWNERNELTGTYRIIVQVRRKDYPPDRPVAWSERLRASTVDINTKIDFDAVQVIDFELT